MSLDETGGGLIGGGTDRAGPVANGSATGVVSGGPIAPGTPVLRWASRAHSVEEVTAELGRIWGSISLTTPGEAGGLERRVAARSSVMNLVVLAGRGEVGERAAAIIEGLAGRHPSRTIIVSQADPDGPPWMDAQVQAHCVLPSDSAPETCSELVYLTAGGETGQHVAGIVAPLLIHDLPVTVWWPGEPRFESRQARELLGMADRIIVDGSSWSGDGLARLAAMSRLPAQFDVDIADFALVRQSRWREAIASTFDRPTLLPYCATITQVDVTYAARDGQAGNTNIVKPLYHVGWLASRLGMSVENRVRARPGPWSGYEAELRHGRRLIPVVVRPRQDEAPRGTTLEVEIHAERGRSTLVVRTTAYADGVLVRATLDGRELPERRFHAPRKRESDLLADTIEAPGRDAIGHEALSMAAALIGEDAAS